jgi:hypothetical protein
MLSNDEKYAAEGLKLVERVAGVGELTIDGRVFAPIAYEISRYQGILASGLPVPGVHRIEGTVDLTSVPHSAVRVGCDTVLAMENGRTLRVSIASEDGRVLTEGHGPSRCSCC